MLNQNNTLNSIQIDSLEKDLENYIVDSIFSQTLYEAEIFEYKNKSDKYIDQYYYDNSLEKRYKDDLIIYHNLLNYFPENEDDEVIDTLSSQNKKDAVNQKVPNINTNILPNVDIKKNFND